MEGGLSRRVFWGGLGGGGVLAGGGWLEGVGWGLEGCWVEVGWLWRGFG